MVKDLATQSLGMLDRSRMMFLDETTSFSDSNEESDGGDEENKPTKDGKTAALPESDADFTDPVLSVLNVDSTSAAEIQPFAARSVTEIHSTISSFFDFTWI
jgi:hypothetical protein